VKSTKSDSFDEDDDDDLDAWREEEENAAKFDPDEHEHDSFPCPYCKAEVFENADICPKCGSFVSFDDLQQNPSQQPKWVLVTVILLIAVFGGVVGALTWIVH
jgi:hypothetical protein